MSVTVGMKIRVEEVVTEQNTAICAGSGTLPPYTGTTASKGISAETSRAAEGKVKSTSPGEWHVAIDCKVHDN